MPQEKNEIPTYHHASLDAIEVGLEIMRRFQGIKIEFENEAAKDYVAYRRYYAGVILKGIMELIIEEDLKELIIREEHIDKILNDVLQKSPKLVKMTNPADAYAFLENVETAITEIYDSPPKDGTPIITNLSAIGEVMKNKQEIRTTAVNDSLRVYLSNLIKPMKPQIRALLLDPNYKDKWHSLRQMTTFKKIVAGSNNGNLEAN